MKKCAVCLSRIVAFKCKLQCKHVFHRKCVSSLRRCPLCDDIIPHPNELKMLALSNPKALERFYYKYEWTIDSEYVLKRAMVEGKLSVVDCIITFNMDKSMLTRVGMDYIDRNEYKLMVRLLNYHKLNFHITVNGKTLLEHARDKNNQIMVNHILSFYVPGPSVINPGNDNKPFNSGNDNRPFNSGNNNRPFNFENDNRPFNINNTIIRPTAPPLTPSNINKV